MRRVDKSLLDVPVSLRPDNRRFASELARNSTTSATRARGETAAFKFQLYKQPDVRSTLEELFHGKCAYCESRYVGTQPVDIEHFRPKARVAGVKKFLGYWWLAADWNNLLPSCIDCNRARNQQSLSRSDLDELIASKGSQSASNKPAKYLQGKADAFPLLDEDTRAIGPDGTHRTRTIANEKACLINPAEPGYRFEKFFRYDFTRRDTYGVLILPVGLKKGTTGLDDDTVRALQTIEICGLNRLALLQARQRALIEVDFLIEILMTALEGKRLDEAPSKRLFARQERIALDALRFKKSDEGEFCQMIRAYLDDTLDPAEQEGD